MAAAALSGQDRVLGLRTAALAWGLPVSSFPSRVELVRPPGSRRPSTARVVRRALDVDMVSLVKGVPVTCLERTAVDVSLDLPSPQALVTVDAALRRGADRRLMQKMLNNMGSVPGVGQARTTLQWADGHSESALESRSRGELLVRGAPRPWCNVSFRIDDLEFRLDHWWKGLALGGEADGALKYSSDQGNPAVLWKEKLRQDWFEDEVGLSVMRYIDREVRLAPRGLYARFARKLERCSGQVWVPPTELEIFRRPLPHEGDGWTWFRRRDG